MLQVFAVVSSKKTIICLILLSLFVWLGPFVVLAGDDKEKESEKIVVLHAGEWVINAGGQVRLRGDFAKNQNFTDFKFTPGHDEAQFLERTRLQASIENHALNLKAFIQGQWYGRWGGLDDRSAFDLYQGFIEWEKILGSPVSLKGGRQEFLYGSAFFIGTNAFYNGLTWDGLKGSVNPFEGLTIDVLGSKMVKLNPGDPNIYLAGLYSTYKIYKEGSLEAISSITRVVSRFLIEKLLSLILVRSGLHWGAGLWAR